MFDPHQGFSDKGHGCRQNYFKNGRAAVRDEPCPQIACICRGEVRNKIRVAKVCRKGSDEE